MLQFQEIQTFLIKVRGWEEEIPSTKGKAQGMSGRGPVFTRGFAVVLALSPSSAPRLVPEHCLCPRGK